MLTSFQRCSNPLPTSQDIFSCPRLPAPRFWCYQLVLSRKEKWIFPLDTKQCLWERLLIFCSATWLVIYKGYWFTKTTNLLSFTVADGAERADMMIRGGPCMNDGNNLKLSYCLVYFMIEMRWVVETVLTARPDPRICMARRYHLKSFTTQTLEDGKTRLWHISSKETVLCWTLVDLQVSVDEHLCWLKSDNSR